MTVSLMKLTQRGVRRRSVTPFAYLDASDLFIVGRLDSIAVSDEPQTDFLMAVADTLGYEPRNNVEDYSAGVSNDLAKITGAYVRGE